jgi:hypothetical protein
VFRPSYIILPETPVRVSVGIMARVERDGSLRKKWVGTVQISIVVGYAFKTKIPFL